MNQQDTDMLQIAIGSAERFNEDAPTPAYPDPFRDRHLLESLLDNSPKNSSANPTNWQSGPDRAIVEKSLWTKKWEDFLISWLES